MYIVVASWVSFAIVNRPFCFSVDWFLVPRVGTSTKQLHFLKPIRSLVFLLSRLYLIEETTGSYGDTPKLKYHPGFSSLLIAAIFANSRRFSRRDS